MDYQTFEPNEDLNAIVKCFWTLEVPGDLQAPKQRIVPDGCIEMCFIIGEDIKRYTSEDEFIIQPRAMVIGQITKPYYIQPTGYVNTFAIRFYPYGFANLINLPINKLADKETPLTQLFEEKLVKELEQRMIEASSTPKRLNIIEGFLLNQLTDQATVDGIVKSTVDTLAQTKGSPSVQSILENNLAKRRSLERKFSSQVGISPKKLGKIIRLQTALKMLLKDESDNLTHVAYDSGYYDQAHFIKDFKELTGTNPKSYFSDEHLLLSSLIYLKD